MAFPYDLEDEDQELAMLDDAPYDSISSRPPLPDTSSTAINPAIKAKIQERMGSQMEDPDGMALKQDRDALLNKQAEGNIFQALSGFSKGGSTPTSDEGLYRNIAAVKQQEMTNLNADAARREKIKAAIAGKQAMLDKAKLDREALGERQTQQQTFQHGENELNRAAQLKAAGIRTSAQQGAATDRQARFMDQDVQKLEKELASPQQLMQNLEEVESKLGFKLNEADVSKGKLLVNGKEVDLPGVSFGGRWSLGQADAQDLKDTVAKVFNTVLKDRSGAAVSNKEMALLKGEFGQGKFNQEYQMIGALQRYMRAAEKEFKNREAGFRPEVVNTYSDRGGRTTLSKDSLPMSASSPTGKTVKVKGYNPKTNQTQIVYTDGTKEIVDGRQ